MLLVKIIVVLATVGTYVMHVRLFSSKLEAKIMSSNSDDAYLQSARSKLILLGRVVIGLSVAIILMAALLDSRA